MNVILKLIVFMFMGPLAFAFPPSPKISAFFTEAADNSRFDFEGIVSLSNCSGAIVMFEGMLETDRAYVMTNGHCVSAKRIPPNTVIYKQYDRRNITVLDSQARSVGSLASVEVSYATMTKTDSALLRVQESYIEIHNRYKVRPLIVASQRGVVGDEIHVVSGYWRTGYACAIDAIVPILKEGSWTFTDSIRYTSSGCKIIAGTSGAPVIKSGTRLVVGINNTANDGDSICSSENPCEVYEDGRRTAIKGASYGQQINEIYSCLDSKFEIDLTVEGCRLM